MRQTTEDLILLEAVGHRHLHGAVERQLSTVHAGEYLVGLLADIFALEQFGAKLRPGGLDLTGEENLLGAGEQRNLAHLRQVHPNRIVRPVFNLLDEHVLGFARGLEFGLGLDLAFRQHARVVVDEQVSVGLFGIGDLGRQILHFLGIGDNVVFEFIKQ